MYQFSIGVMLESFRKPVEEAVASAKALGAQGMQVYGTPGSMALARNGIESKEAQKDFFKMVKDNGLVISALCGDLGKGFTNPELNPGLIETSKRILDLALEFETNVVTTHIGKVPEDSGSDVYKIMQDACGELAAYADSLNAHFAIETGPEKSVVLKNFLDSLHSTGVAVNLDPANLVMVSQDDAVQAVYNLKDYIVHTHAKDGRHLTDEEAVALYGPDSKRRHLEMPLGEGDVPFPAYLKALNDIGYKGFLTIEREVGDNPMADIDKAVRFLRELTA